MILYVLFVLMALTSGVVLAVQTGINTQLRTFLGTPIQAVFVSFCVGTAITSLALLGTRTPVAFGLWARMPWWMWLGGVCGLFVVSTNILTAPRLGAALLMSLAITGQLGAALILDHYGAFGFPVHPISFGRVAGGVLLLSGVFLIRTC